MTPPANAGPPDAEAGKNVVRGGCGALLGAFIPLSLGIYLAQPSPLPLAIVTAVSMVVFGFLAVRWGEPFWDWIARWWA